MGVVGLKSASKIVWQHTSYLQYGFSTGILKVRTALSAFVFLLITIQSNAAIHACQIERPIIVVYLFYGLRVDDLLLHNKHAGVHNSFYKT